MKVKEKADNALFGQHVNATHRGTQVFHMAAAPGSLMGASAWLSFETTVKCSAALLQNDPLIAVAARNALAVEVFEQRNGVFAGNSSQVFEGGHVNESLRLVFRRILL